MTDDNLIAPRTRKERQAYVSGWMDAIVMIDNEGLEAARLWLREMAQLELHLIQRDRENPSSAEQKQ
jgi:hypothetical protein